MKEYAPVFHAVTSISNKKKEINYCFATLFSDLVFEFMTFET